MSSTGPPATRIKPLPIARAESRQREKDIRAQYPQFPQVRDVLVFLDQKEDKVKAHILCKFTEKFGAVIREQAAKRAVQTERQAKKDAEIADSRRRWQEQLAREKQLLQNGHSDEDGEDSQESDGAVQRRQSKRSDSTSSSRSRKKDNKQQKQQPPAVQEKGSKNEDRRIVLPKRNAKANPTTGFDPVKSCKRIQERPSPTKINNVVGSAIMKKADPGFRIPKKGSAATKNYRALGPPPDCLSVQDDALETVVFDPLSGILGEMESNKKKPDQQVRESVCLSPERPDRSHRKYIHRMESNSELVNGDVHPRQKDQGMAEEVDTDDILGPDGDSAGIRIYPAKADSDICTDMEVDAEVSNEPSDGMEEGEEVASESSQTDQSPVHVVHRSFSDSLYDDGELDYGCDDDDDDEDDDEDDGNFKRGRKTSTSSRPASSSGRPPDANRQPPAAGIVALIPKTNRSVPVSHPPARAQSMGSNVIKSVTPASGTVALAGFRDDDVEPDSDAILKAKRAARFSKPQQEKNQETFLSFKSKIMNNSINKATKSNEASVPSPLIPAATTSAIPVSDPSAPVSVTKPAVVRKKTAPTKVALLKDPSARSFSPEPDVDPGATPVIRPKTRKPVKIVNPDALCDAGEVDLFAPPEKVSTPAEPIPVLPVPEVVPHETVFSSNDLTVPVTDVPLVVPVIRRIRQDPRLAARSSAKPTAPAAASASEPLFKTPSVTSSTSISSSADPLPSTSREKISSIDQILFSGNSLPERRTGSDVPSDLFAELRAPVRNNLKSDFVLPFQPQPVSQFNELSANRPNIFIHVLAERSFPRFRSQYEDAPPADIPFNPQSGGDFTDPRIRVLPDGTPDPLAHSDEDEDDEDVPIFGQKDEPSPEPEVVPEVAALPPAPIATTSQSSASDDVFKVPVGMAPRPLKRKLTPEKPDQKRSVKRMKPAPIQNGRKAALAPAPVQKPAALLREPASTRNKAVAVLLTAEISAMREVMKPGRKTMSQRMAEAAGRSEEEEASLIAQSASISSSRSIHSK